MLPRVCLVLFAAFSIYYQVNAVEEVFIAEIMAEGNITLGEETLLTTFVTELQVIGSHGVLHAVTLSETELVAECLLCGSVFQCNCSLGYVWSNEVCYSYGCCRETPCNKNMSDVTPLCVAKVDVQIYGNITRRDNITWSDDHHLVENAFQILNALENITLTGNSLPQSVTFKATVSVTVVTSLLQYIVNKLEKAFSAFMSVQTLGMVTLEAPSGSLLYGSPTDLKCTYENASDSSGWKMTINSMSYELYSGSVLTLIPNCATEEALSCLAIGFSKVTELWLGQFMCTFNVGSVSHNAITSLTVDSLPHDIEMEIIPSIVECTGNTDHVVLVKTTIQVPTEPYVVTWNHSGLVLSDETNTNIEDKMVYSVKAGASCVKSPDAQYVTITFKNTKDQETSARVDIPVIYEGSTFCSEDEDYGLWPNAPAGHTVFNKTCENGRVGYRSRTCEGSTWQPVFSNCFTEELNNILSVAEKFEMGIDATELMANAIFENLVNNSDFEPDSIDAVADISASVNILSVMATASQRFDMQRDILPNLVAVSSNILNHSWDGVNNSKIHQMSAKYLNSMEFLVKNMRVNRSDIINSPNVEINFCSGGVCNVSVFNISLAVESTPTEIKVIGMKNIIQKLNNNFLSTEPLNYYVVLASRARTDNSSVNISLEFPNQRLRLNKPYCVFWDVDKGDWSNAGCREETDSENQTVCKCNHLTSFSVLMAKDSKPNYTLEIITYVGLAVSICCLLILLVAEYLVWSSVVKSNLSHFRHTSLVNIALFLLLADCSFLASSKPAILSDTWCLFFTVCKHLFFLAMFSWTLCMSTILVHQLIFVFTPVRKRVFMYLSSIVGYVCPILIVGFSYVYCKYTEKKYYHEKTCWLVYERLLVGSIHAFILPVGTVTFLNCFALMVVMMTVLKSSVPDASKADEKKMARSILKVVLFLTPVFGLTWGLGFFLQILESNNPAYPFVEYTFTILNSFQGLFVMITGLGEQKVREEIISRITGKSNSDGTKSLTTTTYSKDK